GTGRASTGCAAHFGWTRVTDQPTRSSPIITKNKGIAYEPQTIGVKPGVAEFSGASQHPPSPYPLPRSAGRGQGEGARFCEPPLNVNFRGHPMKTRRHPTYDRAY